MEDPYQALGVARNASQDDIRTAYRNLAKQHHPDLNPGSAKSEERFKKISAANALLSDPAKRQQFDRGEIDADGQEQAQRRSYRDHADGQDGRRYSAGATQSAGWSQDDLRDIFGSVFSGAHSDETSNVRGQDQRYVMATSFLDATNGATPRLTLPDGRVLDVKIPPGTTDGQTFRLRFQGAAGWNGAARGDALIEVRVAAHGYFTRQGTDILLELPVNLKEAVLGGYVDVPTVGGTVRMRIPPNSDTGTRLRIRGRGVPAHERIKAGDLYATLRVEIGQADDALKGFLRDWTPQHMLNPRRTMEADA